MTITSKKVDTLFRKLDKEFNAAAANSAEELVAGAGSAGSHFNVYLQREPTEEESKKLPKKYDGIPVKYEVTGPFSI